MAPGRGSCSGYELALDRIADPKVAQEVEGELARVRSEARLFRYSPEERQALGVTNSALQLRKSLAAMQLLGRRKEILPHLVRARPEAFAQVVGLRLSLCEARRVLRPLLLATGRAEMLLLGEITAACDRIEDEVASRLASGEISPAERRRLEARFVDPGRLSQLLEESGEARRRRRGRRSARAQAELLARKQRIDRILGRARLRESPLTVIR